MKNTTRVLIIALSLLAATVMAAPSATAVADGDSDDGFKQCKNTLGYNICVGVMYRGCDVWFSFGLGGCWALT